MPKVPVQTIQCSQKRFQVQNDLRDWEIDDGGDPVKVINEKLWVSKGISVDPKHIPKQELVLEKISIVNGKEVIEHLDYEKALKEATLAEAVAIGDVPVDPKDPIKEVKH